MNQRIRFPFPSAFLSIAGAFGTAAAFLSYGPLYADFSLWVLFLIFTFFLSCILERLSPACRIGMVLLLLSAGAFTFFYWHEGFSNSFSLAANVLSEGLSEPYDLIIPPLPVSDPYIGTVPAIRLFFWTTAVITAFSPYSAAGRMTGCFYSLILTFFGFYFGASPALHGLIFSLAYWMSLSLPSSFRHVSSQISVFFCMLLTSLLIMAVVPSQTYRQPEWASHISGQIENFSNEWFGGFFEGGSAFSSVMKGADGRGRLGQGNGIRYTGRPILQFFAPSVSHRLYLRSWAGSVYENSQWHDLPDSAYSPVSSLFEKNRGEWYDQGAWLMEIIAQDPHLQSAAGSASGRSFDMESRRKDFFVNAVLIDTRYYFIPYDASFSAPVFAFDRSPRGSYAQQYETYRWQIPESILKYLSAGTSYGNPYLQTYQHAEQAYRNFVYDHYLDVPAPVLAAIRRSVQIPSVHTEAEKQAWISYVQQFFQKNFQYTETPGRVPSGYDFIDWFLNYHREGYCTYFASAGTMMLRAAGIPARYVVGQTAGADEIDKAPLSEAGLHTLTLDDHHSHAWTEVYVDGIGWRPVEMTPGLSGSESPYVSDGPAEASSSAKGSSSSPKSSGGSTATDPQQTPIPPASPVSPPAAAPVLQENHPSPAPERSLSLELTALAAVLLTASTGCLGWFYVRSKKRKFFLTHIPAERSFHSFGQPLFVYALKLIKYAGLPGPGTSYSEWTALIMKDPRFSVPGFSRFMLMIMKSRFSGKPVAREEAETALSVLSGIRDCIMEELPAYKKWIFTFWRGL